MTPGLATRLDGVEESASAAMTEKARLLRLAGKRVISLSSGEPDFPTPDHALDAADAAARKGDTKYPPQNGTAALKAAVRRKFLRENGLDYADNEVLIANGAKQIIFDAMMATCNPGDEVVIPVPAWISYLDIARFAGARVVPVTCPQNNGFKPRAVDIAAAITPRTKWVFLNSPSNPSGAVCTPEEIAAIGEALLAHPQVWILTDDIYEHLIYDGLRFAAIAQVVPALRDRVLTVNGASKAYAMTGWRVGYCGGPRKLIAAMENVQGQSTGGITTVAQAAAVAALDGSQAVVAERAAEYAARRDMVVDLLNAIPGIVCHKPQGAFYVFPSIAGCLGKVSEGGRLIATDADFVMALLDEQQVASVQGAAYGMSPYFRISYATDTATLREGCERIAAFCGGLREV